MKEFEDYKKEIFDFEYFNSKAKEGFDERLGEPEELEAAIGLISVSFSDLEDEISKAITRMLNISKELGDIITCELSYKIKVHIFSSLIQHLKESYHFNAVPGHEDEYYKELVKALFKCEELRNRIMHSSYIKDFQNGKRHIRRKKTAKAKRGLIETTEMFQTYHLLNIYDYIVSTTATH
jgi:ribosomal protein L35